MTMDSEERGDTLVSLCEIEDSLYVDKRAAPQPLASQPATPQSAEAPACTGIVACTGSLEGQPPAEKDLKLVMCGLLLEDTARIGLSMSDLRCVLKAHPAFQQIPVLAI